MEDNKSITGSQNRQILPVQFVDEIKQIVEHGLREAYDGANSILVKTYWNVGKRIVEEENTEYYYRFRGDATVQFADSVIVADITAAEAAALL